jgi:ribonucleoside-diphosphate reductase alpha chain
MGIHEWLLQRGHKYEVVPELHNWLSVYKGISDKVSKEFANRLSITVPVANRAVAPTGTIGILAGTTTGIEPLFAVAYKRRYLKGNSRWHYQYVVDSAAQGLIDLYGVDPNEIESAIDLAEDYERRIKFQADVQDYVDMAISSTINMPAWGSKHNNEDKVDEFANTLAKYAPRLRGFTCYPDGSRGGQPLTSVPYSEAVSKLGEEFEEHLETHDICELSGNGGSCGI